MDQASWHQSYLGEEYSNLTIIHIPPYSPELNPVEQVWSWLRQNELANRCFDSDEEIVDSINSSIFHYLRSPTIPLFVPSDPFLFYMPT